MWRCVWFEGTPISWFEDLQYQFGQSRNCLVKFINKLDYFVVDLVFNCDFVDITRIVFNCVSMDAVG